MIRINAEYLEKALQNLSDYLYLLKDKPTEHMEAVWREKVVIVLEDLAFYARTRQKWMDHEKTEKMLKGLMRLPDDIKRFVEGQ